MSMYEIFEKRGVSKQLKKAPKDVLVKYEAWKRIVELEGPRGLKLIKGFHDESLKGKWKSYRSSRLGIKWRVIYKSEKDTFFVYVFEVNPHTY